MRRTLILSAAMAALLSSASLALADLAAPKASPAEPGKIVFYTSLEVVPDSKASDARLQISRETLQRINEAAGNSSSSPSMARTLMHSSSRTIMAGVFMFLAVSFGGVWLARSNQRRSHRAIAAGVLVVVFLGVTAILVRANAGPPGYIRWQNLPQSLKDGKSTRGGADIEIVNSGNGIKLIVPLHNERRPGE